MADIKIYGTLLNQTESGKIAYAYQVWHTGKNKDVQTLLDELADKTSSCVYILENSEPKNGSVVFNKDTKTFWILDDDDNIVSEIPIESADIRQYKGIIQINNLLNINDANDGDCYSVVNHYEDGLYDDEDVVYGDETYKSGTLFIYKNNKWIVPENQPDMTSVLKVEEPPINLYLPTAMKGWTYPNSYGKGSIPGVRLADFEAYRFDKGTYKKQLSSANRGSTTWTLFAPYARYFNNEYSAGVFSPEDYEEFCNMKKTIAELSNTIDTSWPYTPSDEHTPSTKLVKDSLAGKVDNSAISDMATKSWVNTQGFIKDVDTANTVCSINYTTGRASLPVSVSSIGYWDGSYNETSKYSNLKYCAFGAFGSMAVKNANDYFTSAVTSAKIADAHVPFTTNSNNGVRNNNKFRQIVKYVIPEAYRSSIHYVIESFDVLDTVAYSGNLGGTLYLHVRFANANVTHISAGVDNQKLVGAFICAYNSSTFTLSVYATADDAWNSWSFTTRTHKSLFSHGENVLVSFPSGETCAYSEYIGPTAPTKTSQLTNDSGFITAVPESDILRLSTKSCIDYSRYASKLTSVSAIAYWNGAYDASGFSNLAFCDQGRFGTMATKDAADYATQAWVINNGYISQIKSINGQSLVGSGNIEIGGSNVTIDTAWPSTPSDSKVPSTKLVLAQFSDYYNAATCENNFLSMFGGSQMSISSGTEIFNAKTIGGRDYDLDIKYTTSGLVGIFRIPSAPVSGYIPRPQWIDKNNQTHTLAYQEECATKTSELENDNEYISRSEVFIGISYDDDGNIIKDIRKKGLIYADYTEGSACSVKLNIEGMPGYENLHNFLLNNVIHVRSICYDEEGFEYLYENSVNYIRADAECIRISFKSEIVKPKSKKYFKIEVYKDHTQYDV